MSKKTMKDLRANFDHVGVVVRNIEDAAKYYERLGFDPFESMGAVPYGREVHGEPSDVVNYAMGSHISSLKVELVQPVSGESVQKEFLDSKGEGINHLCFEVDDIDEATSIMADEGFEPVSSCKFKGGGGMAYFDTDRVGGVLLELVEWPQNS